MATVDRPLSVHESLRGLLAAFRLMDRQLGIDLDATAISFNVAGRPDTLINVAGRPDTLISVTLADLIRRADTALDVADMAKRNPDVPGEHSPLPWQSPANPDEPYVIWDATGTPVAQIEAEVIPEAETLATLAFVIRAANAFPLLITQLDAASHALRSYQFGNTATDLAKDVADACDVVLAQMEGR